LKEEYRDLNEKIRHNFVTKYERSGKMEAGRFKSPRGGNKRANPYQAEEKSSRSKTSKERASMN
jgi:hypothetical protein